MYIQLARKSLSRALTSVSLRVSLGLKLTIFFPFHRRKLHFSLNTWYPLPTSGDEKLEMLYLKINGKLFDGATTCGEKPLIM